MVVGLLRVVDKKYLVCVIDREFDVMSWNLSAVQSLPFILDHSTSQVSSDCLPPHFSFSSSFSCRLAIHRYERPHTLERVAVSVIGKKCG